MMIALDRVAQLGRRQLDQQRAPTSRAASVISAGQARPSRATWQATSSTPPGPAPNGADDETVPAMTSRTQPG